MTIYETLKSEKMTAVELEELFYEELDEAIDRLKQEEKKMRLDSARDDLADATIYYFEVLTDGRYALSFEDIVKLIKRAFEQ